MLTELIRALEGLETNMLETEKNHRDLLRSLPASQQAACCNLLHYLALRSEDIRDLQYRLHIAGLSSLSSAESHIHAQLTAILERLGKPPAAGNMHCDYQQALADIEQKAKSLFGAKTDKAIPYIMVTLEAGLADDYESLKTLLASGMNVARINCAHDDEAIWNKMIINLEKASAETSLPCKIYMDLAGPKIRTTLPGCKKKKIEIKEGGKLLLAGSKSSAGGEETIPVVGSTLNGIAAQLKEGAKVLFDDGLIECTVENVQGDTALLKITRISSKKPYLKRGKGINFPGSKLVISSLTDFDRACLPFVCSHADLIGYSFVHSAADIAGLQNLLAGSPGKRPSIILKIETAESVEHFPLLLMQGMKETVFGVMIARGDLAIELGFERMGEIQEEIMWICEAAHTPVIWATQVLENLNESGLATRSEITDAGYSSLSECVMINKGKHIVQVITTLQNIFKRSGGHHSKKRYLFRPLNIARAYIRQND
ncbi:MAG: pyruvate kinase [Puia sp.]|nr:pyruvate kinase [Puia sp.]